LAAIGNLGGWNRLDGGVLLYGEGAQPIAVEQGQTMELSDCSKPQKDPRRSIEGVSSSKLVCHHQIEHLQPKTNRDSTNQNSGAKFFEVKIHQIYKECLKYSNQISKNQRRKPR
jgi:hypothetical protein